MEFCAGYRKSRRVSGGGEGAREGGGNAEDEGSGPQAGSSHARTGSRGSHSYLAARAPASRPRPLGAAARPGGGGDAAGPRRLRGWDTARPGPLAGASSRSGARRPGNSPAPGRGRLPSSRPRRRPTCGCPGATPRPSPPPSLLPPLPPRRRRRPPRPRSPGYRGSTPAWSTTRAEEKGRPRLRPGGPAQPPAGCAPSRSPGPAAPGGLPGRPGRRPQPRLLQPAGLTRELAVRASAWHPRAAAAARGWSSPSRSLVPRAPRSGAALCRRSHVLFFPGSAACSPPPPAPSARLPGPGFASAGLRRGEVALAASARPAIPGPAFQVEPGSRAAPTFLWGGSRKEGVLGRPAPLEKESWVCPCLQDLEIMLRPCPSPA